MKAKLTSSSVHKVFVLLLAGAAIALAVIYWVGCRRSPPAPAEGAADGGKRSAPIIPDPYLGPLDTVRLVHQYRQEGQLAAVEPYLVPEQRPAVIEHVLSIGELAAAGESLKARVSRFIGTGSADALDRTAGVNALGPFSRDVECLSQAVEGDTAVVKISVGGRLPLEEVHLIRGDDRWLIQTDPPIPGLSDELRKLARVLNQVADQVERGQLSSDQIQNELAIRERPIMKRIGDLLGATEAASDG